MNEEHPNPPTQPESTMNADVPLITRHKQERKDLQSKIQSLKKSVPKGDKKKKKEITEEIAKLEYDLNARHTSELGTVQTTDVLNNSHQEENGDEELAIKDNEEGDDEATTTRISRAQKRRNKKATIECEREKRIVEQAERNKDGPRLMELNAISTVLKDLGLELHNIAADGNCLYCAVNHQLETNGRPTFTVSKLRKITAEFMRENKDEFLPFMYNESDEPVSEEYFEDYCKEVASTKLWGGQLELRALSNILKCPIKVIQASGPPTLQGENFSGPALILAYHRHLYRLGEHYNSTIVASNQSSDND